jgi:hypothetical protein
MQTHPARRVLTRRHRGHLFEIYDDGGEGWIVVVHGSNAGREPPYDELRNRAPGGLEVLITEARRRVDRRLDGGGAPLGRW